MKKAITIFTVLIITLSAYSQVSYYKYNNNSYLIHTFEVMNYPDPFIAISIPSVLDNKKQIELCIPQKEINNFLSCLEDIKVKSREVFTLMESKRGYTIKQLDVKLPEINVIFPDEENFHRWGIPIRSNVSVIKDIDGSYSISFGYYDLRATDYPYSHHKGGHFTQASVDSIDILINAIKKHKI